MNKEELIGKLQMVYVGDKNALNEMIDYYDELFDEMESWREEAKELKKQLEEKNKPQIFIDTQDIEERYAEELYQDFLKEENKKIKKQLEECYCNRTDCSSRIKNSKKYDSLVQRVENQQKEFIKWLEDYLNLFDYRDIDEQAGYDMLEEILQKYRSIIGCDKVE